MRPAGGLPARAGGCGVFTTLQLTFYVVAQSRGRCFLSEILGENFGGVLVSDCLAIYDDATALQHKCYAHHHKAIRKAKDLHPQPGRGLLMRSGGNVACRRRTPTAESSP